MPGLHHPVARAFARDGKAVELSGKADSEIGDINHLLNLAEPLGQDLAGFERNEPAKFVLRSSELLTENPHELATFRRRHTPPSMEGILGETDSAPRFIKCRLSNIRNDLASDRRAGSQALVSEH